MGRIQIQIMHAHVVFGPAQPAFAAPGRAGNSSARGRPPDSVLKVCWFARFGGTNVFSGAFDKPELGGVAGDSRIDDRESEIPWHVPLLEARGHQRRTRIEPRTTLVPALPVACVAEDRALRVVLDLAPAATAEYSFSGGIHEEIIRYLSCYVEQVGYRNATFAGTGRIEMMAAAAIGPVWPSMCPAVRRSGRFK